MHWNFEFTSPLNCYSILVFLEWIRFRTETIRHSFIFFLLDVFFYFIRFWFNQFAQVHKKDSHIKLMDLSMNVFKKKKHKIVACFVLFSIGKIYLPPFFPYSILLLLFHWPKYINCNWGWAKGYESFNGCDGGFEWYILAHTYFRQIRSYTCCQKTFYKNLISINKHFT